MSTRLRGALAARTGAEDLVGVVLGISRIPYGRPSTPSSEAVLVDWRGTCSTKHLLLRDVALEAWPELRPRLVHRIYRVTPELAARRWNDDVAATVPEDGLVDVHTYALLDIGGAAVPVDVTFALDGWDGRSPIPLECGDGVDHAGGPDPMASKASLVALHCDRRVREPFITALSTVQ